MSGTSERRNRAWEGHRRSGGGGEGTGEAPGLVGSGEAAGKGRVAEVGEGEEGGKEEKKKRSAKIREPLSEVRNQLKV